MKRSRGLATIGLIAVLGGGIALVLVLGWGVMVAPTRALTRSAVALGSVKSFRITAESSLKVMAKEIRTYRAMLSSGADFFNGTLPKGTFEFRIVDDTDEELAKMAFRGVGDMFYFRFDALRMDAFTPSRGTENVWFYEGFPIQAIIGKWIEVDPQKLGAGLDEKLIGGIAQKKIAELNVEKIRRVRETLSRAKLFERTSLPTPAFIDGMFAWKMGVRVLPDGVVSFLRDIDAVLAEMPEQAPSDGFADLRSALDDWNRKYVMIAWIGWNGLPLKFTAEPVLVSEPTVEAPVKMTDFAMRFGDYNEPLGIAAPAPSEPFEDVLAKVYREVYGIDLYDLLKKSRDARRISDLDTLKAAIGFYLINEEKPSLAGSGGCADEWSKTVYVSLTSSENLPLLPPGWRWGFSPTPENVDGTGWIPVDFTKLRGGSPISRLPVDPVGRADMPIGKRLFYAYVCRRSDSAFVLNANMESEFFSKGGEGDVESVDGGKWPYIYEVGTDVKLSPGGEADIYYLP